MKYITTFETANAYNAAKDNLISPNVSYIEETNGVAYKPYVPTPPTPSHDFVDLGLPSGTKWATMNVGANSITDYGNYYQYGKGSAQYAVTSGQSDYSGTEDPLATSADTARQVWGGNWHMPTQAQLNELIANTTYEWTTIDGVNGGKFTAQNGNYIFIPAAGSYNSGIQFDEGSVGNVWSSFPSSRSDAYSLFFMDSFKDVNYNSRGLGFSVRPVMNGNS